MRIIRYGSNRKEHEATMERLTAEANEKRKGAVMDGTNVREKCVVKTSATGRKKWKVRHD